MTTNTRGPQIQGSRQNRDRGGVVSHLRTLHYAPRLGKQKDSFPLRRGAAGGRMPNMSERSMISFDWAIKRLLRQKANFEVLEGFLSELLHRDIVIKNIGESEGNKDREDQKTNRVEVLAEADGSEIVIIEVQYYGEDDFFKRILYGACKAIHDHLPKGWTYRNIRKIYSVSIVYFDLGAGDDYVYRGFTDFTGLHTHTTLQLSPKQKSLYGKTFPGDLHPEYYIIKLGKFNDVAKNTLDEWVYYLKNSRIRDDFTARGLDAAREVLAYYKLTEEEKRQYEDEAHMDRVRNAEIVTSFTDGLIKGEAIGLEKGLEKVVVNAHHAGHSMEAIVLITSLTREQIIDILQRNQLVPNDPGEE